MFTNQISSIVQKLMAAGMPTEQANVFAELGNCSGPLDHRAPVTIDSTPSQKRQSPDGAPSVIADTITAQNVTNHYWTERVSNWDSRVVETGGQTIVEGGYTQIINGTLYVDYIVGPEGTYVSMANVVEQEVLTGASIDSEGNLVFTRKTVKVLDSVALADLTLTGTNVTLVEDVDWAAPDLNQRKRTSIKVLHAGTQGDYENVDTAVACSTS